MRIAIPTLPSAASVSLKAILEKAGYLVVTEFPSYTIRMERGEHPWIVVDVPDALFGRLLTHRIGELAPWDGVFVRANGNNKNDKAATIEVPDDDAKALEAVCVGTMRALDQVQKLASQPAKEAAAPFLSASELLSNAVDVLKGAIQQASTTVVGDLTQVVTSSATATSQDFARVLSDQGSVTYGQLQHCVLETTRARQVLFHDLMTYYERPRWYQWAYWVPPKG